MHEHNPTGISQRAAGVRVIAPGFWGNATFLLAIVTLFAWIAAVAARLRTPHAAP